MNVYYEKLWLLLYEIILYPQADTQLSSERGQEHTVDRQKAFFLLLLSCVQFALHYVIKLYRYFAMGRVLLSTITSVLFFVFLKLSASYIMWED